MFQKDNNCDITVVNQHGFKQKRSKGANAIELQTIIVRAAYDDKFVLVSSLELSAAFETINIDLLIKGK
jgi:hypothetical protein